VVKVPSVLGDRRLPDGSWDYMIDKERKIGYIRLSTFSETAPSEMKEALTTLNQQGMTGLILDLRGNPGGLIRAAVEIADMFLDQGRIVSTKGRVAQEEVFEATGPGTILQPAREHPITVIINRYSASASEILAAALQDHARAVVVGERSFGKGSVQNVIEMESRASALKLTTASYWRPSGKNIHRFPDSKETDDWGVSPDKGHAVKLEDKERINYLRWRNDRDVVRKADQPARKPVLPDFKDTVLEKALEATRAKLQAHG
jgi:carboxyl-terminal processing protease